MKKIFVLFFILISFKIYSQDEKSLVVIDNLNKPQLKQNEINYLAKRGIVLNYNWNNTEVNSLINIGLKKRKIANSFLMAFFASEIIGIITHSFEINEGNSYTNQNSQEHNSGHGSSIQTPIGAYILYSIGGGFLITSIINSVNASKTIKKAAIIISKR